MVTHFGSTDEEDGDTQGLCGTNAEFNMDMDWDMVTCKKCLKRKESYNASMKAAMEHSVRDMAGYMEFIKRQE
jgi:hypothetical protein